MAPEVHDFEIVRRGYDRAHLNLLGGAVRRR
jgi:hypothetical protein